MKNKHDIMWLEEVDSTNEEARRRISDIDNLSVLSSFRQTAGRGQRGNKWSSAPGENLTFSIVLKYALQADRQFVISEIAALAVVDFLYECGIDAMIKWPNDIYVGNRKICGILIENSLRGNTLSHSIVGIGLNVNQTVFDPSLPNPTSIALCRPDHHQDPSLRHPDPSLRHPERSEGSLPRMLDRFMEIFTSYVDRYMYNDDAHCALRTLYLDRMWRLNEKASYIDTATGTQFTGAIRGLSDIGLLIVELDDGRIREFGFKEIGYIL